MPPIVPQKGEVSSPPPTYCKCHEEMALSCQHSCGFISAEENCLFQGHTSSQSSPHPMTDERGGWAALPVIPTQSISEGPSPLHGPLRAQPIPMSRRLSLSLCPILLPPQVIVQRLFFKIFSKSILDIFLSLFYCKTSKQKFLRTMTKLNSN